jgi:hypothetical protein
MLLGQKIENSAGCQACVVYQNIDAPQRSVRFFDKSLGIGRLGQISRYGDDFTVCLARNLRRRCFERLLAAGADRDIDTLASQGKGDPLANPGAPAGDECSLPVHPEIHEGSIRSNTAMRMYQGLPAAIRCQSRRDRSRRVLKHG